MGDMCHNHFFFNEWSLIKELFMKMWLGLMGNIKG